MQAIKTIWNLLRQSGLFLWEQAAFTVPIVGLALVALWFFLWKKLPCFAWHRRWMPVICAVYLAGASYIYWYHHRPLPDSISEEIFPGVHYTRGVFAEPANLVVHLVRINLRQPGMEFVVTPGDNSKGREMIARTTSEFAEEFDVQVAINGGYFYPWYSNEPLYYYPHSGDPVDVNGVAVSRGVPYSDCELQFNSLNIYSNNIATIGKGDTNAFNVISGLWLLVKRGVVNPRLYYAPRHDELHPRTAVGITADQSEMIWIVIDGRQPNYSEGATLAQVAESLVRHGAYHALTFDGGGSSTLVMRNDGKTTVMNTPIRGRIPPGLERPVGNHLGLRVRELAGPPDRPKAGG